MANVLILKWMKTPNSASNHRNCSSVGRAELIRRNFHSKNQNNLVKEDYYQHYEIQKRSYPFKMPQH